MTEYIPSPSNWVREQVELYEGSGGTEGTTLRDTGLPVIIVTNTGQPDGGGTQDAAHAGEGREQLRAGGLEGRCAGEPRVGIQPPGERRRGDQGPHRGVQ